MLIEFLTPNDLTEKERQGFWDQDISMDDWNYMLIVPPNALHQVEYDEQEKADRYWEPKKFYLDNMLDYTLESKWFNNILFRGKMVGVGIVYH